LFQKETREEWSTVFYITACINIVGGLAFILLCKADIEPWAVVVVNDNIVSKSTIEF
jgi:hypothetical protein